MALYNEILAGRFNERLIKLFGMKQQAPAPQVAGEVAPVIDVSAIAPEDRSLGGEQLWHGMAYVGAAALQYQGVQLVNPSGSNLLGVCDRIIVGTSAQGTVNFGLFSGEAPGLVSTDKWPRDGRLQLGYYAYTTAIRIVGSDNFAVPAVKGGAAYLAAGLSLIIDGPWVVTPGTRLWIAAGAQNVSVLASFFWRQRAMLESEL